MAAGKRHLLLPILTVPSGAVAPNPSSLWIKHANRSLFYGELPCPWYPDTGGEGWETLKWMAESNIALAMRLADAMLVGEGALPFTSYWFVQLQRQGEEGPLAFVTLNNDSEDAKRCSVSLARYITLGTATATQYQAMLWDGVAALTPLGGKSDGATVSRRVFDVGLGPGEVKLIAFAPVKIAQELMRGPNPQPEGRALAKRRDGAAPTKAGARIASTAVPRARLLLLLFGLAALALLALGGHRFRAQICAA